MIEGNTDVIEAGMSFEPEEQQVEIEVVEVTETVQDNKMIETPPPDDSINNKEDNRKRVRSPKNLKRCGIPSKKSNLIASIEASTV
jgi:hypothetical protein